MESNSLHSSYMYKTKPKADILASKYPGDRGGFTMQVWFSKFIRGRVFSVLFCILGFGLTIYLSSRLGILIEGICRP